MERKLWDTECTLRGPCHQQTWRSGVEGVTTQLGRRRLRCSGDSASMLVRGVGFGVLGPDFAACFLFDLEADISLISLKSMFSINNDDQVSSPQL